MPKLSCSESMTKYCLFFLNLIFSLLGIAAVILGIVLKVKGELIDKIITDLFKTTFSNHWSAYLLIGIGGFILLVGFCGCWGACKESKHMIGFYAFIMIVLILAQLVCAILVGVFYNEVKSSLKDELAKVVKSEAYGNNTEINEAFDTIQSVFTCCGSNNYTDYEESVFTTENPGRNVPYSCCKLKADITPDYGNIKLEDVKDYPTCDKQADFNSPPSKDQDDLYVDGCYSKAISELLSAVWIVIGILAAIWLFEIFCVIAACYVRAAFRDTFS